MPLAPTALTSLEQCLDEVLAVADAMSPSPDNLMKFVGERLLLASQRHVGGNNIIEEAVERARSNTGALSSSRWRQLGNNSDLAKAAAQDNSDSAKATQVSSLEDWSADAWLASKGDDGVHRVAAPLAAALLKRKNLQNSRKRPKTPPRAIDLNGRIYT